MKGFHSMVAAVLVWAVGCGSGTLASRGEFDEQAALGYVEAQLRFGPRVPNTEGHRKAGDWILEQLRARADTAVVQEFNHVTVQGDTLRLRNFIGSFRPELRERILYVAHWDTRPIADNNPPNRRAQPIPGANDGASGVALLLGVADALRKKPPAVGVDLLFVDGEDYGDFSLDRDVLIGSRYYASLVTPDRLPLFAVVFDMVGDRDLAILQEGHSVRRAPEVVERVWSKAAELGYERFFRATVGGAITDDHLPLLDAGIRAINVIDIDYEYWHTTEDTIDKLSARSLKVVGDVAVALLR
jgi:hypothetical protein